METSQHKKLFRSKSDKFLGGVCGGLADYFQIDSNLIRVLFVILAFAGGAAIILYIAALIIIPENPAQEDNQRKKMDTGLLIGIVLIVIGAMLLLKELGLFFHFHYFDFSFSVVWGVLLVGIGLFLLFQSGKAKPADGPEETYHEKVSTGKKLHRSSSDRMLAGVCGGIGTYFAVDSSLIRLGWVFATVFSGGIGLLVYIIMIIIVPEEPLMLTPQEKNE
jgi:phage shock protein PspC (stress-responsive transcriptional regulator)